VESLGNYVTGMGKGILVEMPSTGMDRCLIPGVEALYILYVYTEYSPATLPHGPTLSRAYCSLPSRLQPASNYLTNHPTLTAYHRIYNGIVGHAQVINDFPT
jgi:hypothetical protein